jgi:hypothetical protein
MRDGRTYRGRRSHNLALIIENMKRSLVRCFVRVF